MATLIEVWLSQLKFIATFIMYLSISIIIIYIVSYFLIRRKKNKQLENIQREIIREGEANVKKFKLRYLFTSNQGKNPVNEGKIIAYVMAKNDGNLHSVFAVRRNNFSQVNFYKVPVGEHSDLVRDVTLDDWNFGFDDKNLFLVKNMKQVPNEALYNEKMGSVDTIGNLAPLVHKAILANYVHRIRLREKKLIKLGEDEIRNARQS